MDAITLIFIIIIAVSIMAIAFGYNTALPGYSRHKLLSGISVWEQQLNNRTIGRRIMGCGLILLIMVIVLGVVLGMFVPVRYEYGVYEEIDVFHAQGRSFVMADGLYYEIDHDTYYWINDDYPGIFSQKGFSTFGLEIYTHFKTVDIEGEFYDDYFPDDEESDEE